QWQLGRPRIAAKLIRGRGVVLDVDGRLFRFEKELARAADTEGVVGGLGHAPHLDRILVNYVFVSLGVAGLVVHVPAKAFEEGIDELLADLRFVVVARAIGFRVSIETLDEFDDFAWSGHCFWTWSFGRNTGDILAADRMVVPKKTRKRSTVSS